MFIRDVTQQYYNPADTNDSAPSRTLSIPDIESALAADDSDSLDDDKSDDKSDDKDKSDFDFSLLDDKKNEDDEEESDDKEEKKNDKKDDEEEKELKLEEDEDELELSKIPRRQEIKTAYPDIFKKFPALDHIIHREHAFAEIFPTIKDAESAKESVKSFSQFQSELLSGNIDGVLKAVKTTDTKAFDKIANNLLDSLVRIDPNAHLGITRQVSKGVLNYIHSAATQSLKKNPDDKRAQQLQIASELIHEALYDSTEVTPYQADNRQVEDNPESVKLKNEREQFEKTRYSAAFNTVSSKMNNLLTNAVTRDIDTKNILPEYVKKNVVKDVMSELDRQLVGDTRFRNLIDKLWMRAKENNYNDSSLDNIQKALKEKAKTILPGIMRAKKGEAMKGLNVSQRRDRDKEDTRELSRDNKEDTRTPRDKERLTSTRREEDRNKRKPGESVRDFLMRD